MYNHAPCRISRKGMRPLLLTLTTISFLFAWNAHAQAPASKTTKAPARVWSDTFDSGKLLATGGVSTVEGAGGGGLAPWATITGYGTDAGIGANAHYTGVYLPDFDFHAAGVAVGIHDRLELSYSRVWFDTGDTGGNLGIGDGYTFRQHVFGAKLRLFGDAVYDQDRILPQVAVGVQHKRNDSENGVLSAIGAAGDSGTDFYISATKLILGHSLLVNGTVRATKANQTGILGFGGDKNDDHTVEFEGSLVYLLSRRWAIGAEYRTKPNNLSFADEDDWFDLFAAWFINKNLSLTVAYADLGDIALQNNQRGLYVSLQAGF